MKELSSVGQKVYVQDNFLNTEQIKKYIKKVIPFPEEKRQECIDRIKDKNYEHIL